MQALRNRMPYPHNVRRLFVTGRWLCLLIPFLLADIAVAQKIIAREYQVKALFLFNFTQFVEWPDNAFERPDSPLIIGILGEDPFGVYLAELLRGETVHGHRVIVERFSAAEDVRGCHILFVNLQTDEELRDALRILRNRSILTVSDAENFTKLGGMVQLYLQDGKIRIRIALEPAKDADLSISSRLLGLADIESREN